MEVEDFINKEKVVDLSFFNFENAITAAYYANDKLEIQETNKNFAKFFPILGNVTNAYFPNVLEQLGIPDEQILQFRTQLDEKGSVLIPQIKIIIDGEERMFSLLSAKTKNDRTAANFNFRCIDHGTNTGRYSATYITNLIKRSIFPYFGKCNFRNNCMIGKG